MMNRYLSTILAVVVFALLAASVNAKPKIHVDEKKFRKKQMSEPKAQNLRGLKKHHHHHHHHHHGAAKGDGEEEDFDQQTDDKHDKKHRIFVQYKGKEGHDKAVLAADRVVIDDDGIDSVVVECGSDCFDRLKEDNTIEVIDNDYPIEAIETIETPSRDGRALQNKNYVWGIKAINAMKVPVSNKKNITVCIVDSGIFRNHPGFAGTNINGTNSVSSGRTWKWDRDGSGHGTHVAGTIASQTDTGRGIVGAGKLNLHITRALDDEGFGSEYTVRRAITQCKDAGANIINMSLGGTSMSTASRDLYTKIVEEYGILLVAASGNQGKSHDFFPASHKRVVSVGAVAQNRRYWAYSNYGFNLEISGPGQDILSTTVSNNQPVYKYFSGTSMASPHYAAAAGLVWSHFPNCTASHIRVALAVSAQELGPNGCDTDYGFGLVDAEAAFNWLNTTERDCLLWNATNKLVGGCNMLDDVLSEEDRPKKYTP